MKNVFCLSCLLVFALMLTGDTAQQTNAQTFSSIKPKFQFKIVVKQY